MAQTGQSYPSQAYRFSVDLLNGRHALSKLVPVALWLADAVLCGLIIWKIPCKLPPRPRL